MRMDDMVKWLEDRGYENVTKKYISKEQFYKFTASKGCCTFSQAFEFPKTPDPILRHSKQLEFLQWFDRHFDYYCDPDPDRIREYFNRNGVEVIDLDVTHAAIEITLCKGGNYYTARRMFIDELVSKFALVQRTVEEILVEFNRSMPTVGKNLLESSAEYKWEPKIIIPTYDTDSAYIKEVIDNMRKPFITAKGVPEIKDVIFNPPATIVFWSDGSKTVVKANGDDEFNPEVGLAMAISKKALGNQGNYYNTFTKWTEKYHDELMHSKFEELESITPIELNFTIPNTKISYEVLNKLGSEVETTKIAFEALVKNREDDHVGN